MKDRCSFENTNAHYSQIRKEWLICQLLKKVCPRMSSSGNGSETTSDMTWLLNYWQFLCERTVKIKYLEGCKQLQKDMTGLQQDTKCVQFSLWSHFSDVYKCWQTNVARLCSTSWALHWLWSGERKFIYSPCKVLSLYSITYVLGGKILTSNRTL